MFSHHFDMTFFPNRIRLTNSRTGRTIDRTSAQPFSSEHRMLADREVAAKFLSDLLRESDRGRLMPTWPTADVTIAEGQRTDYDQQEVHQLVTDQGFRRVRVSCAPDRET